MDLPRQLRYSSDDAEGIERRVEGGTLAYFNAQGGLIKDTAHLDRIAAMRIPPNWSDVWICEDCNGHIQSTGRDARGRKQYIYHEAYTAYRQQAKFSKLADFAEALPHMREVIKRQLSLKQWTRQRMLALTVRLLDRAHLRIGSKHYERENETYGLTTLRRKHVEEAGKHLQLCFKGKSNKFRQVTIRNRQLAKLVKEVAELPGYELFRYRDTDGTVRQLDSGDVNDYLHHHMGNQFTAKDFRTWGGTTLAVKFYPDALELQEQAARGRLEPKLVGLVATELGNTKSVCREYYIHPDVLAKAANYDLPDQKWRDMPQSTSLAPYEEYAVDLIR